MCVCEKHRGGEGRLLTLSLVLSPTAFLRKAFLADFYCRLWCTIDSHANALADTGQAEGLVPVGGGWLSV